MNHPYLPTPWNPTRPPARYPRLKEDLKADVVIIGGGLTGILTAYTLALKGKSVVVVEKDSLGSGVTSLTTAFLTESLDTDFTALENALGTRPAKSVIRSHRHAIDLIEKITHKHKIECDFKRTSNCIFSNTENGAESLLQESAVAARFGVATKFHKEASFLGFPNYGCIELEQQAMFDPYKFIIGLAEIAQGKGVRIFEKTPATDMTEAEGGIIVTAGKSTVQAPIVISATYSPFLEPLRFYFKKGMYMSYVLEAQIHNAELNDGLFEDTENPYHYLRIEKNETGHRIILGGEDHRRDIPVKEEKNFKALEEYLATLFPEKNYTITKKWKGPILEPIDGLPLIGPLGNTGLLYASAFSGNGMTYAAIAATLLTEHIQGKTSALHKIYAPDRVPEIKALIQKGIDYGSELVGGAIKNTITH